MYSMNAHHHAPIACLLIKHVTMLWHLLDAHAHHTERINSVHAFSFQSFCGLHLGSPSTHFTANRDDEHNCAKTVYICYIFFFFLSIETERERCLDFPFVSRLLPLRRSERTSGRLNKLLRMLNDLKHLGFVPKNVDIVSSVYLQPVAFGCQLIMS